MRAVVIHAAKDLRIEERTVERPGPGEVLIRVAVGGVCGSDLHYYNHGGFGAIRLQEPMILGHEVAGHVVEVGAEVTGGSDRLYPAGCLCHDREAVRRQDLARDRAIGRMIVHDQHSRRHLRILTPHWTSGYRVTPVSTQCAIAAGLAAWLSRRGPARTTSPGPGR